MMDGRALDELSLERQRGLLGELNFLEHLLLPTLAPIDAVRAWQGPSGSHQDFIHQDAAAEVKSTITKRHSLLRIQSEKQLDDAIFRVLFLVHVRLDESAKGISLPEQVATTREPLSGKPLALNELNLKLIEAGYRDADSAKYSDKHYVVTEPMIYRVHGNFPRMTEANLPGGVGDLSYTIVADGLGDFLLPHAEFKELVRPQNG